MMKIENNISMITSCQKLSICIFWFECIQCKYRILLSAAEIINQISCVLGQLARAKINSRCALCKNYPLRFLWRRFFFIFFIFGKMKKDEKR